MSLTVPAIYEGGVFKPTCPITDLGESTSVILTIRKPLDLEALRTLRGTLSPEEAEEMMRVIQEGRRVEGTW